MGREDKYYIDIYLGDEDDNDTSSLINEINSLKPMKNSKSIESDDEPVVIGSVIKTKKEKKKKKKNKSIFAGAFDTDESDDETSSLLDNDEDEISVLLDVDEILREREEIDNDDIIDEQKKGYKKLKKQDNEYKKEFAEELTLLYTLLDETSKFSKDVEKKYRALDGQKVRGVSKYTNDLAQIVLNAKQSKLSILKEIAGVKKTVVDLKIKADGKDKTNANNEKNPEYIASAYFKNVLNHGRTDFIKRMSSEDDDDLDSFVDHIETRKSMGISGLTTPDDETYFEQLENRLKNEESYRSEAGDKYIEYENRGVKIFVKKCIDTGEWKFLAIDKYKEIVDDYPVPTKREAGKMKFNNDGSYATDEKGRMYKVIEYYLPDESYDDDDGDEDDE